MSHPIHERIRGAQVVLPCDELDASHRFFVDRLGFRLAAIFPADAPRVVVLEGAGLTLRLDRDASGPPGTLRFKVRDLDGLDLHEDRLRAPNGTLIQLVEDEVVLEIPSPDSALVVHRLGDDASWVEGRAGMRYRDLIPGRVGGRFIASHIQIPEGGPVPDYVHYHRVRFQMIYCYRGWVRVVYEDQGEPFVLNAGDCVLQPPEIRHRVLEASQGLEVIEVGCPALHETLVDHELVLPNAELAPERDFGGQRFVRHQAADAPWAPWRLPGLVARSIGIAEATRGLADARVVRCEGSEDLSQDAHDGEFLCLFVLEGAVEFVGPAGREKLACGDCVSVPAEMRYGLERRSEDLEFLEIRLPADLAG
jgi:mannose-6-phosphate isomerase-like protein (cupin superfamily)